MQYSRIDAELSKEDLEIITGCIETIRSKLPFTISLSAKERQQIDKNGSYHNNFVGKALEQAETWPQVLPANFSLPKFRKRKKLHHDLVGIISVLISLEEALDDTRAAVGYDCYKDALTVYKYIKVTEKDMPGAEILVNELKAFFPNTGRHFTKNSPGVNQDQENTDKESNR